MLGRYVRLLFSGPRNARFYLIAGGLSAITMGVFGAVYNLWLVALGHSFTFVGTLATAGYVGAGLGALVAGRLVDWLGPRQVLLASSIVAAAGIAAQLLLPEIPVLLSGSVVTGIGAAAFAVAAPPFLARAAGPEVRDDLFSLDTAVALAGAAVGSAAGGQGAALLLGAEVAPLWAYWWTLAGASAVGASSFVALLMTEEKHNSPPAPTGGQQAKWAGFEARVTDDAAPKLGWVKVLREPAVFRLAMFSSLIALGAGLFIPYLNLFFVQELGASPAVYGWLGALATVTRLLATLAAPVLAGRIGAVRAIGGTQLVSIPLLLVLGFSPWLALAGTALLVRGALMNMAAPLQMSFRMTVLPPRMHGTGNATIWVADSAVRAVSTFAGGWLIDQVGFRPPYAVTAAVYAAAAVLFLRWFGGSGNRLPNRIAEGDEGN
jgi:MFS family permease